MLSSISLFFLTKSSVRWGGMAVLMTLLALMLLVGRAVSVPILEYPEHRMVVQVPRGATFKSLIRELEWLGLLRTSLSWRIFGRLSNPVIQAGEYRIDRGDSMLAVLDKMKRGEQIQYPMTVVEGWTLAELRRALRDNPRLSQGTRSWSDDRLITELGCPDCFAEGRFLPETYLHVRGDSDFSILERAYAAMSDVLSNAWHNRRGALPLTGPDELLILASLIEKETALPSERDAIAGVFVRRLEADMRLQTDPTVIYGIGARFDGNLTRADLRNDHPWNTYTRKGLPSTPIALPGRASIQAGANPADGTALYFVAKGDGSHVFSDTLSEHNQAVNKYIRGRE